ncbi:hypothetical protein R5W24_006354 [Gemmata sp. JC717]|uniref:hypothetical protein n=1 Tax=Gemmata algarum TaxID=2975278 RepID=UPI0021BB0DF8|nr:hypothetical protein [Gemmata algarum]MDY3557167.1 hypothetical protein [Gemmata algarum]
MSCDVQNPERRERLRRLAILALKIILPLVLGTGVGVQVAPETVREVEKRIEVPAANPRADEFEYVPTQGWVRDDDAIRANLDPARTLHFDATPAGRAALGDDDVYLWRAVRKAARLSDSAYPNVNQQSVGCCVGCGWKHACDVVQATAIAQGAAFEWKPVSVEVIYAGSRVQVGKGQISGDGSVGAWAAQWCRDFGVVPMEKHGAVDLSTFRPARARQWGQRGAGVPDQLEALAKAHPVKQTALVRSATDVKRALAQGYPIAVCSDQGFTMGRDDQGFARPQGSWSHCMSFIAWRGGSRPGALCLNSWGDAAHTGPVWPPDAPAAAFWVDESVVDRMVRQGDSFALSDVQGFPARRIPIDWFVNRTHRGRDGAGRSALDALAW